MKNLLNNNVIIVLIIILLLHCDSSEIGMWVIE